MNEEIKCRFDCSVCDHYEDCEEKRYLHSCPRDIEYDFPCENCNYYETCEKAFKI